MASKDKALFEIRKYNDFSVLCSDDEEMTNSPQEAPVASSSTSHVEVSSGAVSAQTEEAGGFETFTTVRRPKRVVQPKTSVPAASVVAAARTLGKPKEVVVPKPENSIELYEFPSTLKTVDLRKFLNDFDGHYRLKWINDTSCYVVFDEESLSQRALTELKDDNIKIKSYIEPASAEAQLN